MSAIQIGNVFGSMYMAGLNCALSVLGGIGGKALAGSLVAEQVVTHLCEQGDAKLFDGGVANLYHELRDLADGLFPNIGCGRSFHTLDYYRRKIGSEAMCHDGIFRGEIAQPEQSSEYTDFARVYDTLYRDKGYDRECEFIVDILNKHGARSVLDIGCGTGNHLSRLENRGFDCEGLDANSSMLDVAREKVKGRLTHANMTGFNLGRRFDAIICMYASFNHLLAFEDALMALKCFERHLNDGGIALIDLHNPASDGKKIDTNGEIEREMMWRVDRMRGLEFSTITFKTPERVIRGGRVLRLYSINDMKALSGAAGFGGFSAYDGYSFRRGRASSKNLEVVGFKRA